MADGLVQRAKELIDQIAVFQHLNDSRYVAGWVVVSYDPYTEGIHATGIFEHPRDAQAHAEDTQVQITSDGSEGLAQMVMPLYDWDR